MASAQAQPPPCARVTPLLSTALCRRARDSGVLPVVAPPSRASWAALFPQGPPTHGLRVALRAAALALGCYRKQVTPSVPVTSSFHGPPNRPAGRPPGCCPQALGRETSPGFCPAAPVGPRSQWGGVGWAPLLLHCGLGPPASRGHQVCRPRGPERESTLAEVTGQGWQRPGAIPGRPELEVSLGRSANC